MIGYAFNVYISKDIGDKIIEALEALKKAESIKNSEFFRRGLNIYTEAIKIFIENRNKFYDLNDFDNWLIQVIEELKNKIKEVSPEEFKKIRGV